MLLALFGYRKKRDGEVMDFDGFISKLKSIQGLEDLQPNTNGSYSLRINRIHLIFISNSFDFKDLFLYAPVCYLPLGERERLSLFDRLLSANMFGQDTGDAWFATDAQSHQILLISRLPLFHLTTKIFSSELQKFISFLSHWKTLIEKLPALSVTSITKETPNKQSVHIKP